MIRKELNRFEYIHLTKGSKTFYVEIFKGEYQKLKVGDKVLCSFENEEIDFYATRRNHGYFRNGSSCICY